MRGVAGLPVPRGGPRRPVAVVTTDDRQVACARELAGRGWPVRCWGRPVEGLPGGEDPAALDGAAVVVGPVTGPPTAERMTTAGARWREPAAWRLAPGDRVVNALFLSVSARTGGFNAIDYARASETGNFLTMMLMMVGGSPGSTAGGLKTTTVALLAILAWSRFHGEETVSIAGRSLRKETTDRAIGLFVITFGVVTVGILLLTATERGSPMGTFLDRMFEAVSAFSTVGISTGITGHLSDGGRVVVLALMFLGRVGPLTLAAALARSVAGPTRFRYAYEEVMVG